MIDFRNTFTNEFFNHFLGGLFVSLLPDYEKTCLVEFVESLAEESWFNEESEGKITKQCNQRIQNIVSH